MRVKKWLDCRIGVGVLRVWVTLLARVFRVFNAIGFIAHDLPEKRPQVKQRHADGGVVFGPIW